VSWLVTIISDVTVMTHGAFFEGEQGTWDSLIYLWFEKFHLQFWKVRKEIFKVRQSATRDLKKRARAKKNFRELILFRYFLF
jgi:hypothetical protein